VAGAAALVEARAADVPLDDGGDDVVVQPEGAGPAPRQICQISHPVSMSAASSRVASREIQQVYGPAPRGMAMRWHNLS
jgi:hypothetical protein